MKKILFTIVLAVFLLPVGNNGLIIKENLNLTVQASLNLAHADILTSLMAQYKLNEGTGTTASDSTGNGHTGTTNGDFAWHSPGKIGASSASYSGTTGGGVSFTRWEPGTTFTYAAWIYIPSGTVNTFANLMTNGNGTGLWVVSSKIDYDAAGGGHLSNTTITRDTWHHIAVVNNANAVTFYLDGSADGTATVAQDQFFDGMGCDSGTAGECFTGYQDDVRVYTRALSSSDITELYNYTETTTTFRRFFFNAVMRFKSIIKFN
jgi:hypothetical protein